MKVALPLAYEEDDAKSSTSDDDLHVVNPRSIPILHVNGHRISNELATRARPNQTLLSFLREELHLTGSKLGCGEGGCGACTVLISKLDRNNKDNSITHVTVNACLFPILAADGAHITTIEGLVMSIIITMKVRGKQEEIQHHCIPSNVPWQSCMAHNVGSVHLGLLLRYMVY